MRIRFLSEQVFENVGPNKGPRFPAGHVLDEADVAKVLGTEVTPEYARGFLGRWVQRNVAVEVDGRARPDDVTEVRPADADRGEPARAPALATGSATPAGPAAASAPAAADAAEPASAPKPASPTVAEMKRDATGKPSAKR